MPNISLNQTVVSLLSPLIGKIAKILSMGAGFDFGVTQAFLIEAAKISFKFLYNSDLIQYNGLHRD